MSAALPKDLTCRELVEVITDYLEGAMSHEDRTRFEQHLVACGTCRVYVRQMRATIRAAGRTAAEESIPEPTKSALLQMFRAWKADR